MRSSLLDHAERSVEPGSFQLQNDRMLKVDLRGTGGFFFAKQGSMVAYQGDVDFAYEGTPSPVPNGPARVRPRRPPRAPPATGPWPASPAPNRASRSPPPSATPSRPSPTGGSNGAYAPSTWPSP